MRSLVALLSASNSIFSWIWLMVIAISSRNCSSWLTLLAAALWILMTRLVSCLVVASGKRFAWKIVSSIVAGLVFKRF